MRVAQLNRNTNETTIAMTLNLDGQGQFKGQSGIGFFDHMLTLFSRYSGFDLDLDAQGDLDVDTHHLIEDLGIVMGLLLKDCLGECRGIERYGSFRCPMDEALTAVDLDISGRGYLVYHVKHQREKVGAFETEMLKEFLYALAINAGITLHVNNFYGDNEHHLIESIFKALGKALGKAVAITDKTGSIPSTKGRIGA